MDYRIIDISKDLITSEVYPGDPVPELSVFSAISSGSGCNMAKLSTTLHCGTHADAPLHFINNSNDISRVDVGRFIGECVVIEVPEGEITGEYVDNYFPRTAKRLLIKGNGKAWFDKTGAEEVAFFGISLIGTDGMSVGCPGNQTGPHRAFLSENIAILENLDLSQVTPGRYFLIAPPVKICGVDGAPVRALLLDGYIFWST